MEGIHIFLWVMIGIIILIAGYITFIYIMLRISFHKMKDKNMLETRAYPCYLNILLSSVIAIDNISRLIANKKGDFFCKFQAFVLAVFDKLILCTITVNAFLTYLGLSNNEFYMNNIKKLFIITNCISLVISFILGIIFLINGVSDYNVCYVAGGPFKENIDSVVTFILFLIFLYSILNSLIFMLKNIKELSSKIVNAAYLLHFYRMFFSLFLSSFAFIITLLIINDSLFVDDDFIDLCFIITCLAIDLFYTLNSTVIKQTLIIFKCSKEEERETDFSFNEENDINDLNENRYSLDYMNEE